MQFPLWAQVFLSPFLLPRTEKLNLSFHVFFFFSPRRWSFLSKKKTKLYITPRLTQVFTLRSSVKTTNGNLKKAHLFLLLLFATCVQCSPLQTNTQTFLFFFFFLLLKSEEISKIYDQLETMCYFFSQEQEKTYCKPRAYISHNAFLASPWGWIDR